MKIHVTSDLHIDHHTVVLPVVDADIVVVAGDIAGGPEAVSRGLQRIRKQVGPGRHVLYVPGNHDWYGADLVRDRATATLLWTKAGATVLDCGTFQFSAENRIYRLIGATWWSAMDWTEQGLRGEQAFADVANRAFALVADYRFIQHGGRKIQPWQIKPIHEAETAFLIREIGAAKAAGEIPIVITHYLPSRRSIHAQYTGDLLNAYFANDREDLTAGVPLWIHGHTHCSFDYVLPTGCRVVCNPHGYGHENPAFDRKLVITI